MVPGNQDIVEKALSQLGNVNGEPYWRWWGFNYRIAWCACFVSWCADQCGFTQDGTVPKFILCMDGANWFKSHNQFYYRGSYTPISGDYIFFDWDYDGWIDHVGFVDYCEDGIVYTVEGNTSNQCKRRKYKTTSASIYGYARPSYQP